VVQKVCVCLQRRRGTLRPGERKERYWSLGRKKSTNIGVKERRGEELVSQVSIKERVPEKELL